MRKLAAAIVISLLLLGTVPFTVQAAEPSAVNNVWLEARSGTGSSASVIDPAQLKIGDEFAVWVQISGATDLKGAEVQLDFTPGTLEIQDGWVKGVIKNVVAAEDSDQAAGTMIYAASNTGADDYASAFLLKIPFKVVANGSARIAFQQGYPKFSSGSAQWIAPGEVGDALSFAVTPEGTSSDGPAVDNVWLEARSGTGSSASIIDPGQLSVGDEFAVWVQMSGAIDIKGAEVQLDFTPGTLEIQDGWVKGVIKNVVAAEDADHVAGTMIYAASNTGADDYASAFLLKIPFKVLANGSGNIGFLQGYPKFSSGSAEWVTPGQIGGALSFTIGSSVPSDSPVLRIDPVNTSLGVGSQVDVQVKLDGATDIHGIDIELTYDPAILEVVETHEGQIKDAIALQTSGNGRIRFAASNTNPANYHNAVVLTVTFKGLTTGTSTIGFRKNQLSDPIPEFVANEAQGGSVSVVSGGQIAGNVKLRRASGNHAGASVTISIAGNDQSVFTDTAGDFILSGVPAGQHIVKITADGYLVEKRNANVVMGQMANIGNVAMRAGDANADNLVDLRDLTLLAMSYETSVGQTAYDVRCDFNEDGKIDLRDLTLLAIYYYEVGD